MSSTSSQPLFVVKGIEFDFRLCLSLVIILVLGLLQISWPAIQAYFVVKPQPKELPEMPIIETISEDPVKQAPRKRFVKDKASIASWAAQAPATDLTKYQDHDETTLEDPNSMLPAGLEKMERSNIRTNEDGKLLDLDGTVIEDGTIAYIRQQIIDRVINTGAAAEDENESAEMKLDIIKSVRQLSDSEVVEWYIENKSMLAY